MQLQGNAVVKASYQKKTAETLLRKKREWTIPPKVLQENKDYTHLSYIARVSHSSAPFPNFYCLSRIFENLFPPKIPRGNFY